VSSIKEPVGVIMFKMFSHVYMRRFCIQSSITKVLSSFFPIDKVTSHICLLWPILMVFYIRLRVSCAEQQNISIELEWYIWEREAQALTYIDERSSHSATEKYRKKEKKNQRNFSSKFVDSVQYSSISCMHIWSMTTSTSP